MRKRFIVLVDNSTLEQEEEFIKYIKENRFGWWHYINNSWLITTNNDIKASDIRDVLKNVFTKENNLVIELRGATDDTWAGFGPKNSKRNMFTWLKNTWNKKN